MKTIFYLFKLLPVILMIALLYLFLHCLNTNSTKKSETLFKEVVNTENSSRKNSLPSASFARAQEYIKAMNNMIRCHESYIQALYDDEDYETADVWSDSVVYYYDKADSIYKLMYGDKNKMKFKNINPTDN